MRNWFPYFSLFALIALLISFTHCNSNIKEKQKAESCCIKKDSAQSEITCPECGYKKTETMPTDVCLLKYTCEKCKTDLYAKQGDCCVFCSYGDHKCPSMQEEKKNR